MTNQSINLDLLQESAPRLYVACLCAYNNGHLHGCWIDANQEPEAIWQEINNMLANSPMDNAQEWAIHDYENFSSLSLDEQHDIEELSQWAELISTHSDDPDAVSAYISWAKDTGIEITSEEFTSRYCGHWQSGEDFALKSDEIQELYNWSQFEKDHQFWSTVIDWEKVGRELELSDAYCYIDASPGIYVFRYY